MSEDILNDEFWNGILDRINNEETPTQTYGPFDDPVMINPNVDGVYIGRLVYDVTNAEDFKRCWLRRFAYHWNLIQSEENPEPVGCPKWSHGEHCLICEAADELIATGRATRKDLYGFKAQNKWIAQTKWFVRFLLLKFVPHKEGEAKLNEPILRFFPVPYRVRIALHNMSMGSEDEGLVDEVEARKKGREKLFSWDKGRLLKISRGDTVDKYWAVDIVGDPFPIPAKFRNPDTWPNIDVCMPKVHERDMVKLVAENHRDIPEIITSSIQRLSAIPVESSEVPKAIPEKTVSVDEVNTAPAKKEEAVTPEVMPTDDDDLEARLANL